MVRISLTLAAVALLLGACADAYEPVPKTTSLTPDTIVSNTASLSHIYVRNAASQFVTCTTPQPDAVFDQGETADINISLISVSGGSDAGGEGEDTQEIEMAGRTPAVLMARELFFRACEFSQNYRLTKDEALGLYKNTLDVVGRGWAKEAGQTTVTIGDKLQTTSGTTNKSTETGSVSAAESKTTSGTPATSVPDSTSTDGTSTGN